MSIPISGQQPAGDFFETYNKLFVIDKSDSKAPAPGGEAGLRTWKVRQIDVKRLMSDSNEDFRKTIQLLAQNNQLVGGQTKEGGVQLRADIYADLQRRKIENLDLKTKDAAGVGPKIGDDEDELLDVGDNVQVIDQDFFNIQINQMLLIIPHEAMVETEGPNEKDREQSKIAASSRNENDTSSGKSTAGSAAKTDPRAAASKTDDVAGKHVKELSTQRTDEFRKEEKEKDDQALEQHHEILGKEIHRQEKHLQRKHSARKTEAATEADIEKAIREGRPPPPRKPA